MAAKRRETNARDIGVRLSSQAFCAAVLLRHLQLEGDSAKGATVDKFFDEFVEMKILDDFKECFEIPIDEFLKLFPLQQILASPKFAKKIVRRFV